MKPILCIPSYCRPDGIAIERCKNLPLKKFIFIRKEQKKLYSKWEDHYILVTQITGTDIGKVRRNIMTWSSKHGYDWVFMLDDDISKVEVLGKKPDGTITSQRIIDRISGPRMEIKAFKEWFKQTTKNNLVLSSPNHRAFDRFHHGQLFVNKSACIQCVLVYVPAIIAVGNYKSLRDTGNEDYYIQYLLMREGYKVGKIGTIEYDCPAVGSGEGGNNAGEYTNLAEKYNTYVDTFLTNVCSDPKIITTKITKTGQKSIQFVWKNWGGYSIPLKLL